MGQELLDKLQRRISSRSLLAHPFYQDWKQGKLSLDDLRLYAGQYYHFEANFPRFLSAVHSRCPDTGVRQSILTNLWDEESGERNHRSLWLGFCAALGLDSEQVEATTAISGTQTLVDTYSGICSDRSYQEGLAVIYAYEAQVPEIAAEKRAGLIQRYGLADDDSLSFFQVHSYLDMEHSRLEAEAICQHTDAEQEPAVESALQAGLDAWWGFLDGINELRLQAVVR